MDNTKAVSLPYAVKLMRMQRDDLLQFCDKSTYDLVYFSELDLEMAENFGSVVAYRSIEEERMKRLLIASEFLSDPERFIPLVRLTTDKYFEFIYSFIDKQGSSDSAKRLRSSVKSLFSFNKLSNFNKTVSKLSLTDQWNDHENECFLEIARDWCEKHSLPYTYDMIEPVIVLEHIDGEQADFDDEEPDVEEEEISDENDD